jgi:hypothetical protein
MCLSIRKKGVFLQPIEEHGHPAYGFPAPG